MTKGKYVTVDIKEITTPKTGRIAYVDYCWFVKDEKILVYQYLDNNYYQCNRDKQVLDYLQANRKDTENNPYYGFDIVQIPVAYIERQY